MAEKIIEKIKLPDDIKNLDIKELNELATEVREKIIDTVATNGGHLSSNLGIVETTIAVHKCFNSPEDKIIFDVGHQAYAHKILTGRYDCFNTLRKENGISGFQNCFESEHDPFIEGHSGTSISEALGIAEANKIKGNDNYVISIVGDGSFTNGMCFEALNNCSNKALKLIIILNDNDMSISKNIGGIHNHFSKMRTSPRYFELKRGLSKFLNAIPLIGKPLNKFFRGTKNLIKRALLGKNIFECLGVSYLGPVDGNDIKKVAILLEEAKKRKEISIIHVKTKKGKGYKFSEDDPSKYHSIGSFCKETGEPYSSNSIDFSTKFGEIITEIAENDEKICAITAAMTDGTGLKEFSNKYPNRFFDVGIAEEHAITFASGLSENGLIPVCALYSTFSQRTYDQLFHDISIQKLPLTLMIDRAGLVPNDGITHQGIMDVSMMTTLKNIEIYSVDTYKELEYCFKESINSKLLSVIRYPKGEENDYNDINVEFIDYKDYKISSNFEKAKTIIITYGRVTKNAIRAVELLGNKVAVLKLIKIYPLNFEELKKYIKGKKLVYILEEGIKAGGIGEKISSLLCENNCDVNIRIRAITNYPNHGELEDLYKKCGLDENQIAKEISSI